MKITLNFLNSSSFLKIPTLISSTLLKTISKVYKVFYLYLVVVSQTSISKEPSNLSPNLESIENIVPGFTLGSIGACSFVNKMPIPTGVCDFFVEQQREKYQNDSRNEKLKYLLPYYYNDGCIKAIKSSYKPTVKYIKICQNPEFEKRYKMAFDYIKNVMLNKKVKIFKNNQNIANAIYSINQILSNGQYLIRNNNENLLRQRVLLKNAYETFTAKQWQDFFFKKNSSTQLEFFFQTKRELKEEKQELSIESLLLLKGLDIIYPNHQKLRDLFNQMCTNIQINMRLIKQNKKSPIDLAAQTYFDIWQYQFFQNHNNYIAFLIMNAILIEGKETPAIFPDYIELNHVLNAIKYDDQSIENLSDYISENLV